jgi:hypothetical protein
MVRPYTSTYWPGTKWAAVSFVPAQDRAQVVWERLAANVKVATAVLGSIPASSDTVESEGAAAEEVLNNVHKKIKKKILPVNIK